MIVKKSTPERCLHSNQMCFNVEYVKTYPKWHGYFSIFCSERPLTELTKGGIHRKKGARITYDWTSHAK